MPTVANMGNMAIISDITQKRRKLKICHARHAEYLLNTSMQQPILSKRCQNVSKEYAQRD